MSQSTTTQENYDTPIQLIEKSDGRTNNHSNKDRNSFRLVRTPAWATQGLDMDEGWDSLSSTSSESRSSCIESNNSEEECQCEHPIIASFCLPQSPKGSIQALNMREASPDIVETSQPSSTNDEKTTTYIKRFNFDNHSEDDISTASSQDFDSSQMSFEDDNGFSPTCNENHIETKIKNDICNETEGVFVIDTGILSDTSDSVSSIDCFFLTTSNHIMHTTNLE